MKCKDNSKNGYIRIFDLQNYDYIFKNNALVIHSEYFQTYFFQKQNSLKKLNIKHLRHYSNAIHHSIFGLKAFNLLKI